MSKFRPIVSIISLVSLIYGLYAIYYLPKQQRRTDYQYQILSLSQDITELKSRVTSFDNSQTAAVFPEELVWKAATITDAELTLQDSILKLAEKNGISLITFSTSSMTRSTSKENVAFEFEAESELSKIYEFLVDLEALKPKVAISLMRIRPSQGYNASSSGILVYSQILLWTFWEEG